MAPDYVLCSSKVEERLVPLLAKNLVACNHFQLKFVFVFCYMTLECQMFWFTIRWSGILRIPWPAQIIAKSVSYAKKNNSSIIFFLPNDSDIPPLKALLCPKILSWLFFSSEFSSHRPIARSSLCYKRSSLKFAWVFGFRLLALDIFVAKCWEISYKCQTLLDPFVT